MSSQPPKTLEERVDELEEYVTVISNVLYDLIEELRDKECITELSIPPCPPICAHN